VPVRLDLIAEIAPVGRLSGGLARSSRIGPALQGLARGCLTVALIGAERSCSRPQRALGFASRRAALWRAKLATLARG